MSYIPKFSTLVQYTMQNKCNTIEIVALKGQEKHSGSLKLEFIQILLLTAEEQKY